MNLISSSFCLSDINSVLAYSEVPIEFKNLKGVSGAKLFSKMIASPEELPPSTLETRQDQGRARQSHALYKSMINDDEKKTLKDIHSDAGDVAVLLQHVDHLVLAYLVRAKFRVWEDEQISTAAATKKLGVLALGKAFEGKQGLLVSTIEDLLKDKKFKDEISPPSAADEGTFAVRCSIFRAAYEEYCKSRPGLTRKLGGYLGAQVRYPTLDTYVQDISQGRLGTW